MNLDKKFVVDNLRGIPLTLKTIKIGGVTVLCL